MTKLNKTTQFLYWSQRLQVHESSKNYNAFLEAYKKHMAQLQARQRWHETVILPAFRRQKMHEQQVEEGTRKAFVPCAL